MEQLVARWAHNPKAVGSSPAPATIESQCFTLTFFMPFCELFQKKIAVSVSTKTAIKTKAYYSQIVD